MRTGKMRFYEYYTGRTNVFKVYYFDNRHETPGQNTRWKKVNLKFVMDRIR